MNAALKHRGRALYRRTRREIWNIDQDKQKLIKALSELDAGMEEKEIWQLINYYDPISTRIAYKTRNLVSKLADKHKIL